MFESGSCVLCGLYIVRGECYLIGDYGVCGLCYKNRQSEIRYLNGVNPKFPATVQSVCELVGDINNSLNDSLTADFYKYVDGNISPSSPEEDNIPYTHCFIAYKSSCGRLFSGTFDEIAYLLIGYWMGIEHFKLERAYERA